MEQVAFCPSKTSANLGVGVSVCADNVMLKQWVGLIFEEKNADVILEHFLTPIYHCFRCGRALVVLGYSGIFYLGYLMLVLRV